MPARDEGAEQLTLGSLADIAGLTVADPAVAALPHRRGRGVNKSSPEFARYLIGKYGSQVEAMAAFAALPLVVVMTELRCSALEAHDRQQRAREFVARYQHQAMPTAVIVARPKGFDLLPGDEADDRGSAELIDNPPQPGGEGEE